MLKNLAHRLMAGLVLLSLISGQALAAGGGGGGAIAPSATGSAKTPEQIAASQYRSGLRQKEKALKALAKAESAKTPKAAEKQRKRAEKAFAKAVKHQKKVLKADPRHYLAANELGYALRKGGDYKNAIGAYNYALQLKPDFLEAVEYRGEALMNLGYYEETRKAYIRLFREDQSLAAELMTAMTAWVERQASEGEALSDAQQAFADWVRERQALVSFSSDPAARSDRTLW